jgi:hypothetical protein
MSDTPMILLLVEHLRNRERLEMLAAALPDAVTEEDESQILNLIVEAAGGQRRTFESKAIAQAIARMPIELLLETIKTQSKQLRLF